MDTAAVLAVQVKMEGIAAAAAQLQAFEADLKKAERSAAGGGGGFDQVSMSARSMQVDVEKASGGLQGMEKDLHKASVASNVTFSSFEKTGTQAAGMSRTFSAARQTTSNLASDIEKAGTVSRRAGRDFQVLGDGAGGAGRGFSGLASALGGVPGGFSAIGGAAASMLPVLVALSGPLIAIVSALGPLVGLAAPAAAGLLAFGTAFGVFKLATMGVSQALKEQTTNQGTAASAAISAATQHRAAARAIETAQEGVRTANEAVRTSTEQVTAAEYQAVQAHHAIAAAQEDAWRAQVNLNDAREQATRDLADMHAQLADAAVSEQRAILNLDEARANATKVAKDATSTDFEKRDALLSVMEAENSLQDAQARKARVTEDSRKADIADVENAPGVLAAKEAARQATDNQTAASHGLADANRRVRDAQRALTEANRGVQRALDAVTDAQLNARDSAAGAAQGAQNLNKQMNGLTAPAQAFVRQLLAMKPKLDELKATAAAGLFPGVIDGLRKVTQVFGPVKQIVGDTASALGGLASKAGDLIASPGFGSDLAKIGDRNAKVITTLGDAALHLVDALRHIVAAAGPLTQWLADSVDGWARNVDSMAQAGRESGRLADFFEKTRAITHRVVDIVANLTSALIGIGQVGNPFGNDLLRSFDRITENFAAWTRSAEGRRALTDFFRQTGDAMKQIGPALGTTIAALIDLAFRVLPAYTAVLKILGPLMGPLVQAFVAWKIAATAAAIASGVMTAAQIALNVALTANPIGVIVVGLAALAAGLVLAYEKVGPFHDAVDAVFNFIKDHWPLLLSILTGPVGTAVILIIKHFDDLKGWLDERWDWIKTAAGTGWRLIKEAITAPVVQAIDIIHALLGAGSGLVGWLSERWGDIANGAGTGWHAISSAVTAPITAAVTAVKDLFRGDNGLVEWLGNRWDDITAGATLFATGLKDKVEGVFKGAAGLVAKFVVAILKAIDLIPGVSMKDTIEKVQNGAKAMDLPGFARGGIVNKPIVMMGEEAPRHPEYVIPTNPAYRDRAKMLLGQAAGAIGFAQGGINSLNHVFPAHYLGQPGAALSPDDVFAIAQSQGFPGRAGEQIAHGESGYHPGIIGRDPGGTLGYGLTQVTTGVNGPAFEAIVQKLGGWGQMLNPFKNFAAANWLRNAAGGLSPWNNSTFLGTSASGTAGTSGGGLLGAAGDVLGALNPLNILDDVKGLMPDLGKLPKWLSGMGSWAVDKALDWAKHQVTSLGGLLGGGASSGPEGVGSFGGVPMANWVVESLKFAQSKGVSVIPTSGFRPGFDPHTVSGLSEHAGTQYPHGAVDFGGYDTGLAMKMAVVNATRDFKWPLLAPIGFHDDGHASGTGHKIGGILGQVGGMMGGQSFTLPFGGSFDGGGVVPGRIGQPVGVVAHGGETITPHGQTAGIVIHEYGDRIYHSDVDLELDRRRQAFRLQNVLRGGR